MLHPIARYICAVVALSACSKSTSEPETNQNTVRPDNLPAGFEQFATKVGLRIDGNYIVVTTDDVPDHNSPYFGSGNAKYEAPHQGMSVNPNRISTQQYVLRIPTNPLIATISTDTPLDAIGVALNGVVFFNQYAAGRSPLTNEIVSFDRYNGHPAPRNNYHYHMEPTWLTANGKSKLIGFLLDGFPVYGPQHPDGSTPTLLDSCNGHTTATAEYPGGVYHYHATAASPYLSGCYKGTPGTVSN